MRRSTVFAVVLAGLTSLTGPTGLTGPTSADAQGPVRDWPAPPPPSPPPLPPPGGGGPPRGPQLCADGPALAAAEVDALLRAAAAALSSPGMTVAVVDRAGVVLGIYRRPGAVPEQDDEAVGLARTAAFFSNNQAPLSSRTVRYVSGIHFPPGIPNTANAPLYGIEGTNRGCDLGVTFNPGKELPPATSVVRAGDCDAFDAAGCGPGPVTGKADVLDSDPRSVNPGGVPVFRGATLVGGIGVAVAGPRAAEFAAVSAVLAQGALTPFPSPLPPPGVVFIDGLRLPFVEQVTRPPGTSPGDVAAGAVVDGPRPGTCAPDGYLAGPRAGRFLTRDDVEAIVEQARAAAGRTRAVIRLPIGERARMVIAVGDVDGEILAVFRMPDATVFSVDVAVAKARNVVYFSDPTSGGHLDLPGVPRGTAATNRTISFGAQPLFPPGIDRGSAPPRPGPFFDLFRAAAANPCSQGGQPPGDNQNGVVFFAGAIPLYSGGDLVGGLGVSGDGVEQDDYVAFLGARGFRPPREIWADQVRIDGVRLPFLKFPRNPEQ